MRANLTYGLMRGRWKLAHGEANEAPPRETGGYRWASPTGTAPPLYSAYDPNSHIENMGKNSISWVIKRAEHGISLQVLCLATIGITAIVLVLVFNMEYIRDRVTCVKANGLGGMDCTISRRAPVSETKHNMNMIQSAVEQYATEHHGNYPTGLHSTDFQQSSNVLATLRNPHDETIVGSRLIEEDVTVKEPITKAKIDKRLFRSPGMIRYYVDPTYSRYAIIGSDMHGQPIEDLTGGLNYVLH